MAVNDNNKLVFPMGLSFNTKDTNKIVKEQLKAIQGIVDKQKIVAKITLSVDKATLKETEAALTRIAALQGQSGGSKSSQAAIIKAKAQALDYEAKAARTAMLAQEQLATQRQKTAQQSAAADKMAQLARMQSANADKAAAQAARVSSLTQEDLARKKLQTALAAQRLTTATNNQNRSFISQRNILNGLPQMLGSYFSVMGGLNFLKSMREITGEFEMQRVALTAIIKDKAAADKIFGQLIQLGLQSPFQIKELIGYTKQLAAYRVETEELFDTTSRLSDISAGLGVDMSRLILAFGQVKAASVLRGQELRQFTEAGIPLVQLLSDKFTQLNGELVTTGDVFELISERRVPFAMIRDIFNEMTSAGGSFFNMQKIQATTLKGSWSNLRDAYDKMFYEMGNSNLELMKSSINLFKSLADNWENVFDTIMTVVTAYGAYRAAVALNAVFLGNESKALLASTLASKAKEATLLRQSAAYTKLTAAQWARIHSSERLTAVDIKQMVASGALTQSLALRLIANKRLTAAQIKQLVSMNLITAAQAKQAVSSNILMVRWKALTASLLVFRRAVWATSVALLKSPIFLAGTVIAGIAGAFISASKRAKEFANISKDIVKETGIYANQLSEEYDKIREVVEAGLAPSAPADSVRKAITSLKAIISKNEALVPIMHERLDGIKEEIKQLEILKELYDSISIGSQLEILPANLIPNAIKDTGSWMDKDLLEWTEKLDKRIGSVSTTIQNMSANGVVGIGGIRNSFEQAARSFREGKLTIEEFTKELQAIQRAANEGKGKDWTGLRDQLLSTRVIIGNLRGDAKDFFAYIKSNVTEINGQQIDWTAEKWGLTDANFKQLQVNLSTAKEMWFRTADEIQRGVLNSLWGTEFNISYITPPKPKSGLKTYDKNYNEWLASMQKSGKLSTLTEFKETEQERDIGKELLESLEDKIELEKRINKEVANGNKTREDRLKTLKQEIADLRIASAWAGMNTKNEDKDAKEAIKERIALLSQEISTIEDAYSKYQKLAKQIGEEPAMANVSEMYKGRIPDSFIFTPNSIDDAYSSVISRLRALGVNATDEVFKMVLKQTDFQFDNLSESIKKNLSELSAEIKQTQRANEFFESMLGVTGSVDTANRLVEAMGLKKGNVREGMKKALSTILGDLGVGLDMGNINAIQQAINKLPENTRKVAQEQLDELMKYEEDVLKQIYSGLDNYQTYEDKKKKIIAETAEEIKRIQESSIPSSEKKRLTSASTSRQSEALAGLEWDNFKMSDMYIKLFGDLDKVSTEALESMKSKLVEIMGTVGSALDPTNMKEMISRIEDIQGKLTERNPFKAWADSKGEVDSLGQSIANLQAIIASGDTSGMTDDELIAHSAALDILIDRLGVAEVQSQKAFKQMSDNLSPVADAALGVVAGVKSIFQEFGIGEDTIAFKSLSLLETVGTSAMTVIDATAKVTAGGISKLEKASLILTIISATIAVATKLYNLFSSEDKLNRTIEGLERTISYLESMYDKLKLDTFVNPDSLKKLERELELRKELLEVTKEQMGVETSELKQSIKDSMTSGLNPFSLVVAAKNWIRALFNAGKIKKYNKYISEANERIKYQTELNKILKSDMNTIAKSAKAKVANLKEQNRLLKQQVDAEVRRGKKMDVDKILKLQEQIAENETNIAYAYLDTVNEVIGDVFTNLAESITKALDEAWKSGEDGARAMSNAVKDIMRNIVVDTWRTNVLTAMLKPAVGAIYQAMGLNTDGTVPYNATPDFNIDANEMKEILKIMEDSQGGILESWKSISDLLDGLNMGGGEDLTGISKGIATASEQSIVTLSGYANSLLYYSVGSYNIQARMLEIMEASTSGMSPTDMSVMNNLYVVQTNALGELRAINENTKRNADAAVVMMDFMNKATLNGGKYFNVKLID